MAALERAIRAAGLYHAHMTSSRDLKGWVTGLVPAITAAIFLIVMACVYAAAKPALEAQSGVLTRQMPPLNNVLLLSAGDQDPQTLAVRSAIGEPIMVWQVSLIAAFALILAAAAVSLTTAWRTVNDESKPHASDRVADPTNRRLAGVAGVIVAGIVCVLLGAAFAVSRLGNAGWDIGPSKLSDKIRELSPSLASIVGGHNLAAAFMVICSLVAFTALAVMPTDLHAKKPVERLRTVSLRVAKARSILVWLMAAIVAGGLASQCYFRILSACIPDTTVAAVALTPTPSPAPASSSVEAATTAAAPRTAAEIARSRMNDLALYLALLFSAGMSFLAIAMYAATLAVLRCQIPLDLARQDRNPVRAHRQRLQASGIIDARIPHTLGRITVAALPILTAVCTPMLLALLKRAFEL